MGFWKSVTKPFKKVYKKVTKIVKKTAQRIKRIGKAVMKGVAKVSNKLGPIGMIALSIAMPYALAGLSSMTTAAMGYSQVGAYGNFIRAIGTVGNNIRLGYQSFNASMAAGKSWLGGKFSSISSNIGKAFSNFAPKGTGNMFSRISQGAKNLYNSSKATIKKYMPKPLKAAEGSINVYDSIDPGVISMSSTDAATALANKTISASQLGEQTLTKSGGWFTRVNKAGVTADKMITETINDAYQIRLNNFGSNAKRMFDDVKAYSMKMDTYVSDEQIGNYITGNSAATTSAKPIFNSNMDFAQSKGYQLTTEIDDLAKTGDYTLGTARDRLDGTYNFTGNETFKADAVKSSVLKKTAASTLKDIGKSLLKPSNDLSMDYDFAMYNDGGSTTDVTSSYEGTNFDGSAGGKLIAAVYGEAQAKQMKEYYKNMNLLNDGAVFI
tara:strand:- start:3586 stop:4899 length:1314 start_codon:yes stop_codon:yes gene_type:complete